MQIRALKLQDAHYGNEWFDEVLDHWDYDDMRARANWRQGWVSFDSVLHNPVDDRVYLGITSFDADIFELMIAALVPLWIWVTARLPTRRMPNFIAR